MVFARAPLRGGARRARLSRRGDAREWRARVRSGAKWGFQNLSGALQLLSADATDLCGHKRVSLRVISVRYDRSRRVCRPAKASQAPALRG